MGQHSGQAHHKLGLAIFLAAVLAPSTVRGYNDTQECNSCSIYILDLSSFAHAYGYPVCSLDKVVVDPTTGVVYLGEKDTGIAEKVGHQFGTHSAPWYLMKVGPSCCPLLTHVTWLAITLPPTVTNMKVHAVMDGMNPTNSDVS